MDFSVIVEILIPMATAVGGWAAGRYNRKSTAIETMQKTVDELLKKNTEYISKIAELNNRILELETTNKELVAGQNEMKSKIDELKKENAEMMAKLKVKKQ